MLEEYKEDILKAIQNPSAFKYHLLNDITYDREYFFMMPQLAIELAKKEKQQSIRRRLEETTPKNYGGMINRYNSTPLVDFSTSWTVLDPKPKDEYQKYLEDNDLTPGPTKSYY